MPVTYIELENFKSYAGVQRIGPFHEFTSIIGPNGSGKSNLMDAISFVLGVQSRDLRSSQMKDLVFRPPGKNKKTENAGARAALYYLPEDATADTEEICFARVIHPNGSGEYQVDGKTVTFAQYEKALGKIGVLLKARNFLVFQGDVESLAHKNPKEMVALLEQVSGSNELKEEYDERNKEKEAAEAATIFAFSKQKGLKVERRLLKDQKDEADRFHGMVEKKRQVQTDMYLWQLFSINSRINASEKELEELQETVEELQETEADAQKSLKEAKKLASISRRETQALDKKRVTASAQLSSKLEPALIQVEEEVKNWTKKKKAEEKQLKKLKDTGETHEETLRALEKDIGEYRNSLQELETEYETWRKEQGSSSDNDVILSKEQEEELERLQVAAAAASDEPRRRLTAANRKLTSLRAQVATVQETHQQLSSTQSTVQREIEALSERKSTLQKSLKKFTSEVQSSEKKLQALDRSSRESHQRREVVEGELEETTQKLAQVRDDRRQTREEERLLQAITSLKHHFPGVLGRLVDLCRPTQKRFNLAVTVAGGKDMDAIVVPTKQVGFDCIQYLRDQRIGTATFLPLDGLQGLPSPEQLERLRTNLSKQSDGHQYRLAADVISCAENVQKAVLYAVGTTVICDNLDTARHLCFSSSISGEKVKAVTVGGAVISKAGTMTGGVTKEDANRAGRFPDQQVEQWKQQVEDLEQERTKLQDSSSQIRQMEELRSNLSQFKNRNHYCQSDLNHATKQLQEKTTLLEANTKQLEATEEKKAKLQEGLETAQSQVEEARQVVRDAEEEHLGPFRAKTGLVDLNAYQQVMGQRREEFNKKKRAIVEHQAKLEQQLDYESNRDFQKPLQNSEKRLRDKEDGLEKAEARKVKYLQKVKDAKKKLAEEEKALEKAVKVEQERDEEVLEAQAAFTDAKNERAKATKAIANEEHALERFRGKLHETLQKARVEEIDLPLVKKSKAKRKRVSQNEEDEEDDESEEDEEPQSLSLRSASQTAGWSMPQSQETNATTKFSQAEYPTVAKDRKDTSRIDFSSLRPALKNTSLSDREEAKLQKQFDDELQQLVVDMDDLTPNLKATEAFVSICEKLKESGTDFDKAKADARKASTAFNKIRQKRSEKFTEAFNHIDEALKIIYNDMTKSSKHPLGGEAYLSLDDTEEPYKGGMKFNAMPPMKRFRDMEQLSGGEKTVAALSLLFAIHSFRPAPFFVMDEVDAALDNVNLRKVCNYIAQRSQTDFQCIVISLKDMFYQSSQSLVGICRDVGTNSSRTVTLDLTQFDKKPSKKRPAADSDAQSLTPTGNKRAKQ
mmetsp:Transcript_7203/g.10526  ORF Transcript_7203/g.10526 Transcript_7203/m.10526 type:complete len:1311 (-) Transcript_7203:37-3969(-)